MRGSLAGMRRHAAQLRQAGQHAAADRAQIQAETAARLFAALGPARPEDQPSRIAAAAPDAGHGA